MNYIKELNAFREWLLVNELTASAVVLWYTLMGINNVDRWKRAFNAPNGVVQQLSGLSKSGVHVARNLLVEHGLIKYQPGKVGKAPIYEMFSLVQNNDAFVDHIEDPTVNQPCTILKHKLNKERSEEETNNTLFKIYEQHIGILVPYLRKELIGWVDLMGVEMISEGIKLTSKYNGQTFSYLEKILMEWKAADLTCVEELKGYEKNKVSVKDNTIPFIKSLPTKTLFDELREEIHVRIDKRQFVYWNSLEMFIHAILFQRKKRRCLSHHYYQWIMKG